jgi:hypothetical protein
MSREGSTNGLTYSVRQIFAILESYAAIDGGAFNHDLSTGYEKKTRHSIFHAPYEHSIISKADIDCAIDKLGVPGKWQAYCKHLSDPPAGYGLNVKQFRIAQSILGYDVNIGGIVKELAQIA